MLVRRFLLLIYKPRFSALGYSCTATIFEDFFISDNVIQDIIIFNDLFSNKGVRTILYLHNKLLIDNTKRRLVYNDN